MKLVLLIVLIVLITMLSAQQAKPPHIVFILIDDLGISNVGYSAKIIKEKYLSPNTPYFEADSTNFTPNIDNLASKGVVFTKHYTYCSCTGTRHSMLSGRLPTHVGIQLGPAEAWDGGVNPDNGYDGLSPNITTIGKMMQNNGYTTHLMGKMDGFGMATPQHLPKGRGFNTSLGFFHHADDGYDYSVGPLSVGELPPCLKEIEIPEKTKVQDFWYNDNTGKLSKYYHCNSNLSVYEPCQYEDLVFTQRAVDIISSYENTANAAPLFLYFATHLPHTPLQAPQSFIDDIMKQCAFKNSTFPELCSLQERYIYLAMVKVLDSMVKSIVDALKAKAIYDNTLIVFVSDNGGPEGIFTGGNAFPFRGGKASDFDGGFRVPAFIGGGYIEKKILDSRGSATTNLHYNDIIHVSDWWGTLCNIAGGSICTGVGADPAGDALGFRPVESVNLVPHLTKFLTNQASNPPHPYLHLSPAALITTIKGTLYKLVAGTVGFDLYTSPTYPNCTYGIVFQGVPLPCTNNPGTLCCPNPGMRPLNPAPIGPPPLVYNCAQGCLFNLEIDELEKNDICEANQDICFEAMRQLVRFNESNYEPFHGCHIHNETCTVFKNQWNNTYGPFINVDNCPSCVHTTKAYFASPTAVKKTSNECQCITNNVTCNDNCVWNYADRSCDLKPEFLELTLPQIMALRRFQNYTKGR